MCFIYVSIPIPSIYNQSIPIYLSIGIDNRYQSMTTRIFAIDWSSIISIYRLIDIDWYRLISIVIAHRFHRLDTPGIHSSKIFQMSLTSGAGHPGWSRTRPKVVCCELRSNKHTLSKEIYQLRYGALRFSLIQVSLLQFFSHTKELLIIYKKISILAC